MNSIKNIVLVSCTDKNSFNLEISKLVSEGYVPIDSLQFNYNEKHNVVTYIQQYALFNEEFDFTNNDIISKNFGIME